MSIIDWYWGNTLWFSVFINGGYARLEVQVGRHIYQFGQKAGWFHHFTEEL